MVKTKVKDTGYKAFMESLEVMANKPYVKVGLPAESADTNKERDGITNLELGLVHEFGTQDGTIPERSHHRASFDKNLNDVKKFADKLETKIKTGEIDPLKALAQIGAMMQGNVQEYIKTGQVTPKTEKRNGKQTLVESGVYSSSITFQVVKAKK